MRQVLFYIPLHSVWDRLGDIPVHGWGAMLFVSFVCCLWLAVRLAQREGIAKETIQDLAIWLIVSGVVGARVAYILQYPDDFPTFSDYFKLWHGGMVFYGGFIGAVIAYYVAYFLWLRKRDVSNWKMADVLAPCAALGLALGRMGCLLNGCCFGNVACMDCPAVHFPIGTVPEIVMVERGYQTAAGFTLETVSPTSVYGTTTVRTVEPGSPAEKAGLKPKDKIKKVNDKEIYGYTDILDYFSRYWPRGQTALELVVARTAADGTTAEMPIGPFYPETIGLNPTQVYESISMVLLLFFLLSYYPFKKYDGSVMVLFMVGYGVHRFLNEMLRTDTEPVAFDMTLSQNLSIVILAAALILALAAWRHGRRQASLTIVS